MQRVALAIAFFEFFLASTSATSISTELAEWAVREHFQQFEERFSKTYKTLDERETRFLTFVERLEEVVTKNRALEARGERPVFGVTKFSDLTAEEFAARMLMPTLGAHNFTRPTRGGDDAGEDETPVFVPDASVEVPTSLDWREHGVVTPVKNQKSCGSCWAHSAVETVESLWAMAGHNLTAFSVQQVVSCDDEDGACRGGWYYTAWNSYIATSTGLAREADYEYDTRTSVGFASKCDADKVAAAADASEGLVADTFSWAAPACEEGDCANQDEAALRATLANVGPVSIACDASAWQDYVGGVLFSTSCSSAALDLDHAIQLVGFNADDGELPPYWIVRNSWSSDWGEDGYIYLAMDGTNTCGLVNAAATVALA